MFAFSCSCSVIVVEIFKKVAPCSEVYEGLHNVDTAGAYRPSPEVISSPIANYVVFTRTEVIEKTNEFIYFCITYPDLTLNHRSY